MAPQGLPLAEMVALSTIGWNALFDRISHFAVKEGSILKTDHIDRPTHTFIYLQSKKNKQ